MLQYIGIPLGDGEGVGGRNFCNFYEVSPLNMLPVKEVLGRVPRHKLIA